MLLIHLSHFQPKCFEADAGGLDRFILFNLVSLVSSVGMEVVKLIFIN